LILRLYTKGGVCGRFGAEEKFIKTFLVGEPGEKRQLGRQRRGKGYNITMDIKEIGLDSYGSRWN
jgi:hypothetical protein